MKKLTRYILMEHLWPFIFAFFTITFLLVIDHVPRIIDHVIDKNISIWIALELVALNLAWMLALSVPMAVLVAVLMAFGRLTSDFEITAIKASGINLMRVMMPLLVAGTLIMAGMIQFNDTILPDLNKKARLLWGDIAAMRPTLVFRSGIFISDIPGWLVLIDKIDHTTSRVEGVRITETENRTKPQIVVAEYGFMHYINDGKSLQFTLYNGEIHKLDTEEPENYRRLVFQKHVINIADASSEFKRTDQEYQTDREKNIEQMQVDVSRAKNTIGPFKEKITTTLNQKFKYLYSDTFVFKGEDTVASELAFDQVKREAMNQYQTIQRSRQQIDAQTKLVNKFTVEIYKKYSLPAASLAFILIGAPLGMISRKGGMGMAITTSIIMFVIYWAWIIGGEDLADRDIISPFWATWGANVVFGVAGLYLIYKVVSERPLFSFFRQTGKRRNDKKN